MITIDDLCDKHPKYCPVCPKCIVEDRFCVQFEEYVQMEDE